MRLEKITDNDIRCRAECTVPAHAWCIDTNLCVSEAHERRCKVKIDSKIDKDFVQLFALLVDVDYSREIEMDYIDRRPVNVRRTNTVCSQQH